MKLHYRIFQIYCQYFCRLELSPLLLIAADVPNFFPPFLFFLRGCYSFVAKELAY